MKFLSRIERRPAPVDPAEYPWCLPLVQGLEAIDFSHPVTFLVGENGSGKSTLLEGLAVGMRAVAAGSSDLEDDPTLDGARAFAEAYTFVRRRHAQTRLFLRAEDMFGYMSRSTTLLFGADPHARSHGEAFLQLLEARLRPSGLYFLDEPETPLSPVRVLTLIALLRDAVARGSQFVIATHSPILMALPGAQILALEDGMLAPMPWDSVEHVRITRAFLNDPARFLRELED